MSSAHHSVAALQSNCNIVGCRKFRIDNVSGIPRLCGLEDQDFSFALGHRTMLDTARHDAELARAKSHCRVPKFDLHLAAPDEEQLVLFLVMMPRKHARQLHEFQLLPIELSDDPWSPMLLNGGELLSQRGLLHDQVIAERRPQMQPL